MSKEMKVLVTEGYSKAQIVKMPVPEVSDDMVLVKVCYCGICGTDQDLFSSNCSFVENGQVTYPLRQGHEWSGVVEAVGSNVTKFKKGDKVVGDNIVTCGECEDCKSGNYMACKHQMPVGTIDPVYNGAFAEYYICPERHIHKIPDTITLREAALAEPLSVAYGGIKKMDINENSTVAVIGTGCIGLAAVVLAKCCGAKKVFLIGRNPTKLEVAAKLGAETINIKEVDAVEEIKKQTDGIGVEFVLECSGAAGTFNQAIDISAPKALVALIGFYEQREDGVNIDSIASKMLCMFGVMGEPDNMPGVLKLLENHRPVLSPILTSELDFDDCIKGFNRKNYPNEIKTVVKIAKECDICE